MMRRRMCMTYATDALGLTLRDYFDGVRVVDIASGGPSSRCGVRVGDVISHVTPGGLETGTPETEVRTCTDVMAVLADLCEGDDVVLRIRSTISTSRYS